MTPGSQADLARICGVSRQAISKAVKDGRLAAALLPGGKIDLELGARLFRSSAPKGDLQPAQTLPSSPAVPEPDLLATETPTYREAKTREALAKAALAEMERAEREGRLVPVDEVLRAMTTAGRAVRQQIDAVVGWADELAGKDPRELRIALKAKVRGLEAEAVRAIEAAAGEMIQAETQDDGELAAA